MFAALGTTKVFKYGKCRPCVEYVCASFKRLEKRHSSALVDRQIVSVADLKPATVAAYLHLPGASKVKSLLH